MSSDSIARVRSIVLLCSNRFTGENLLRVTEQVFTSAASKLMFRADDALRSIDQETPDLVVVEVGLASEGDALDVVARCLELAPQPRVVAIAIRCDYRSLVALQSLSVTAVFDAVEDASQNFPAVLRGAAAGVRYWSTTLNRELRRQAPPLSVLLSPTEQFVLALIGDGTDDREAAVTLDLSPATVASIRRNIHRKLGVRHRGELVRIAALNGFVRFTPMGVVRPGLALLESACITRRHRSAAFARLEAALAVC